MGFAREAATRVVFMDQGRIVETAGPETFFTRPATERARQFVARYGSDRAQLTKDTTSDVTSDRAPDAAVTR
jgi:ABC-type proline/glycine betaine transport system ATPase subunit